ncbi:MAG: hypothetical protein ACM3ZT_08930 [Bacillota bacterium]
MRLGVYVLFAAWILAPAAALADTGGTSATDVFSYSTLEADHLHAHSDYFGDSSSGNGFKFSYDFPGGVYLFGQWAKLDFDTLDGSHTLRGVGVGAHQAYSNSTSFYIDLAFLQDKLSGFGSATDDYWRVTYGFRSKATSLLEFDAAILTERNTVFGRRPFGERVGLGLDFSVVSLLASVEHTADGNRSELQLIWAYR